MGEIQKFRHPRNDENVIYGTRIKPGTVLEATDVYADASGKWVSCPADRVGLKLTDGSRNPASMCLWVRPS